MKTIAAGLLLVVAPAALAADRDGLAIAQAAARAPHALGRIEVWNEPYRSSLTQGLSTSIALPDGGSLRAEYSKTDYAAGPDGHRGSMEWRTRLHGPWFGGIRGTWESEPGMSGFGISVGRRF